MTNTTSMAAWLSKNVSAIASQESAGDIYNEVQNAVDAIERMINRPPSEKFCGNCPTPTEDNERCATGLYAKREDAEVICWKCKLTYNVNDLIQQALNEVHDWLWTGDEVLHVMAQIGEPISPRTWRHWRATGKIQSRNELGAEPKYHIDEVRHLRQTFSKNLRAS